MVDSMIHLKTSNKAKNSMVYNRFIILHVIKGEPFIEVLYSQYPFMDILLKYIEINVCAMGE